MFKSDLGGSTRCGRALSERLEVMKAVQEDLGEVTIIIAMSRIIVYEVAQASYLKVKTTLSTYAAPVKGAGGAIKNSIQVSESSRNIS